MRSALQIPAIRQVETAWLLAWIAIWGWLAALGVYVFETAGTGAVSAILVTRMLSGAAAAPFIGALADRRSKLLVLRATAVTEVVLLATAAILTGNDAPYWALLPVAAAEGVAGVALAPAHRALMPWLARTPDELAETNAVTETVSLVGMAAGPALASLAFALDGAPLALALFALLQAMAAIQLLRVKDDQRWAQRAASRGTVWASLRAGVSAFVHQSGLAFDAVLILTAGSFVGAINVLVNPLAIDLLGLGDAGPPLLIALMGCGAVLGGFGVTSALRRFSVPSFVAAGLVLYAVPAATVGIWTELAVVVPAFLVIGFGMVHVNVMTILIPQRLARQHQLSAVLGVVAVLGFGGVGIGGLIGSGVADVAGVDGALLVVAGGVAVMAACLLPAGRRMLRYLPDLSSPLAAIRAVPALAELPITTAEVMARSMERHMFEPGAVIIRWGDACDRFYILEEGSVRVTQEDRTLATLRAPNTFGEIAPLQDTPRTAHVTAVEEVTVWAVDRQAFLTAVATHPVVGSEIRTLAERRHRAATAPR